MSQMKEQNKIPEIELNKMDTSNLPDTDFKTLVIRILNELRRRVDELSENFIKEIGNIIIEVESIEKNQSEMKNILTEMKNTLQGINNRVDEAEDQTAIWKIDKKKTPTQKSKKRNISKNIRVV